MIEVLMGLVVVLAFIVGVLWNRQNVVRQEFSAVRQSARELENRYSALSAEMDRVVRFIGEEMDKRDAAAASFRKEISHRVDEVTNRQAALAMKR